MVKTITLNSCGVEIEYGPTGIKWERIVIDRDRLLPDQRIDFDNWWFHRYPNKSLDGLRIIEFVPTQMRCTHYQSLIDLLKGWEHQYYGLCTTAGIASAAKDKIRQVFGSTKPSIKNVIFNPPATVVLWADGTKTVVKAQEGDVYDAEKGLAMAISKKYFGNKGNYYNQFSEWITSYHDKCSFLHPFADAVKTFVSAFKNPILTDDTLDRLADRTIRGVDV